MKLIEFKKIEGILRVLTGLHIGGNVNIIEIGGMDNPVIKHPLTKEPYIPGSSLKGKMRSLLEWNLDNKIEKDGEVHKWCGDKKCPICRLFGTSDENAAIGPTRLIFRDAYLRGNFKKEMEENSWTLVDISEEKYENTINRITARANPRAFERVTSGVEFDFEVIFRIFDDGDGGKTDKEELFPYVLKGFKLIQKDALGGSGSRGCGKVEFRIKCNDGNYKKVDEITSGDI